MKASATFSRRYPIGAELSAKDETDFRVWAPEAKSVEVAIERESDPKARSCFTLTAEKDGYFSGAARVGEGTLYRFRLNHANDLHPDPASRFQPHGPHGPSLVIDPNRYQWTDQAWKGVRLKGQVIYELHVGTFTREGTWHAAMGELAELARVGVTLIEMMPIAEFPGRFGWGYDGVDLFAPVHLYGEPDDLRRFIDAAHAVAIGVILDVVYNHLGPEGNYLRVFARDYFTDRYETEWGDPLNFDGPNCEPVREFVTANAAYWIDEFHFDGLRLDATQSIFDQSQPRIVTVIASAARRAAKGRAIILIAENEPQDATLVRDQKNGGDGLDGIWNDDFHHSATVALTGRREAYYTDYQGSPQEFISAAKYGFLFQGQYYA
ncbi:MAG: alpha-amylase family glycosyl hydrolase, partial [Verrucomicrobiota bacterium]|nr:alpha-amylase family glycosyl hydrolase [Verrucomicrobiota bacterium]